jgi:hypothetical protein
VGAGGSKTAVTAPPYPGALVSPIVALVGGFRLNTYAAWAPAVCGCRSRFELLKCACGKLRGNFGSTVTEWRVFGAGTEEQSWLIVAKR